MRNCLLTFNITDLCDLEKNNRLKKKKKNLLTNYKLLDKIKHDRRTVCVAALTVFRKTKFMLLVIVFCCCCLCSCCLAQ